MKLNEEQRQLVEDNIGIIYNTIKLTNGNIHNINLIEVGYIGLCKAALYYKKSYNDVSFSTYATTCIKHEICQQYQHNSSYNERMNNNLISLNSFIETDDGKRIELIECIQDTNNFYDNFETMIYIQQIFQILENDCYAKEVVLGYINGKTFKQIAKERNTTPQAVSDKFNRTLNKLRKELI